MSVLSMFKSMFFVVLRRHRITETLYTTHTTRCFAIANSEM